MVKYFLKAFFLEGLKAFLNSLQSIMEACWAMEVNAQHIGLRAAHTRIRMQVNRDANLKKIPQKKSQKKSRRASYKRKKLRGAV